MTNHEAETRATRDLPAALAIADMAAGTLQLSDRRGWAEYRREGDVWKRTKQKRGAHWPLTIAL